MINISKLNGPKIKITINKNYNFKFLETRLKDSNIFIVLKF